MDIGIDLGTTFSVIAVNGNVTLADGYPEGEYLEEFDVTVIRTPEYESTVPSVLIEREDIPGEFIVGMEAKQAAEEGKSPVMWSKRKIGTTEELKLQHGTMTAKDAAREILKYLKGLAERALDGPVRRAVVTHPAYFDPSQVEETRQAAQEAGFDMSVREQVLMEPIAAALAYTRSDPTDPLRIMVYDLGGGTFDVTILERRGGVITPKAFDGDPLLGGFNFDRKLAQWIIDKLAAKGRTIRHDENNPEDRGRYARLLTFAEGVKERLADMGKKTRVPIDVRIDFLVDSEGRNIQVRERISQEEFVALIQEDLDKTIVCCQRCLGKANMTPEDLDYLLLVGGSTHGPWIEELVRQKLGKEPQRVRADLCVAVGAAIHCESLPQVDREGELELVWDTPVQSVLPTIDIGGHLSARDPGMLRGLQVMLKTPQGVTLGPVPLSEDGAFLFQEQPLLEDEPNQFTLQVNDANAARHLEKSLTIAYDPDADTTTILPSLAKSLYIKAAGAAGGLVSLAKEGQELPSSEITMTLERLHTEPTLDIELYQGDERIGTITVEDIPPEAGAGARVVLKVSISDKNEIRGTAEVFVARTGALARSSPVRVKIPPAVIPELMELEQRFRTLENARTQKIVLSEDPEERTILAHAGERLARQIEAKFREISPNRQEIWVLVRELDHLVNPPPEDMNPPRARFDRLLLDCRELLSAKSDDPQLQAYSRMVENCERDGRAAYAEKDQRKWSAIYSSLAALYERLKPREPVGPPPVIPETPILKDQAKMQISECRASLETMRDSLASENPQKYEATYKSRCQTVERMLDELDKKVDEIPDDLPKEQGLPRMQVALRGLQRAQQSIREIPLDIKGK